MLIYKYVIITQSLNSILAAECEKISKLWKKYFPLKRPFLLETSCITFPAICSRTHGQQKKEVSIARNLMCFRLKHSFLKNLLAIIPSPCKEEESKTQIS